jgi:hypothetical protein
MYKWIRNIPRCLSSGCWVATTCDLSHISDRTSRTVWISDPEPKTTFMGSWAHFHVIFLYSGPWASFPTYCYVRYASPFAPIVLSKTEVINVLYPLFPDVDYTSSPFVLPTNIVTIPQCDNCRRYLYISEHASSMKERVEPSVR